MIRYVILAMLMLSTTVYAAESKKTSKKEFYLLDPSLVSIDYAEYERVHDPYLKPNDQKLTHGAKFNLNLDIVKYKLFQVYWENSLFFDQEDTGQIRHAGWFYKFGMPVFYWDQLRVEIYREHESRHILDRERNTHFPMYDKVGVTLILLQRK